MLILKTYHDCNGLDMAKRYLEINGISRLFVTRYDFAENPRKPWRIWECGQNENHGFPCGEFRTKRDALALASKLAAWLSLPPVKTLR